MKKQLSRAILAALIMILGVSVAVSHPNATPASTAAPSAHAPADDLVDINSATRTNSTRFRASARSTPKRLSMAARTQRKRTSSAKRSSPRPPTTRFPA